MKELPQNIELEKAILWYILYNWNEAQDIFIDLEYEYFEDSNLRFIVENIYEMFLTWEFVDLITVDNKIKDKEFYKWMWWRLFLMEVVETLESTSSIWTMITQLILLYKQRQVIKQARVLESIWYSNNLDDWVTQCIQDITKILNEWASGILDMETNIQKLDTYIEENKNKTLVGYSWGLDWLDEYTWGIRKGKTYRIWGMSWVWKTSVVYQVIDNLLQQWAKVLFISLENTIQTTLVNFLSVKQKVNPRLIEKGVVKAEMDYLKQYKDTFIILDSVNDLNWIKREILKNKPDVVILDYIWLVEIKWFDEFSKYNKYADEVRHFIQNNQQFAWIDLSNLNKSETEETIRLYGWFNWSAKLRNNTDFAMHIFWYKPFTDYKKMVLESWEEANKQKMYWKKANTFLITKSRLWDDWIEKQYLINFNEGTIFKEAEKKHLEIWNTLN